MSSVVSNLVDKVKGKKSDDSAPDSSKGEEPAYSIQPHPAKSNDPADLMPEATGGLGSDPIGKAFHARDPHLPTAQVMAGLEKPATREELQARQAELNK
ncbi:hypothetical protein C8J57DRAFT_1327618 [Mycena rebaudengoi]|nr:hypothetical protein C8J57DRAFT_1327618 [Mycena rebaudengoi]